MAINYMTTIHTMELKATTSLSLSEIGKLDYIRDIRPTSQGRYKLTVNPHKVNARLDSQGLYQWRYLTLSEQLERLKQIRQDLQTENLTISRLDLCCDPQIDYMATEKIIRLLILMLADKTKAQNRYLSIDPLTLEVKTLRIEARQGYNGAQYNGELQVEHYNRALLDQSNWDAVVVNRLELRCMGVEAGENYSIEDIAKRWKSRLEAVTSDLEYDSRIEAVERQVNSALIARWKQFAGQVDSSRGSFFNDFVLYNLKYIFTRRQLLDLFRLYGDDEQQALYRDKNLRRTRRKAFRHQFITKTQLCEEVASITQGIETFIRN